MHCGVLVSSARNTKARMFGSQRESTAKSRLPRPAQQQPIKVTPEKLDSRQQQKLVQNDKKELDRKRTKISSSSARKRRRSKDDKDNQDADDQLKYPIGTRVKKVR